MAKMQIIKKILQKFGRNSAPKSLNDSSAPQYEICVICGETTTVLIDTPIDCRRFYVHGCGQLCEKCAIILRRVEEKKYYKNDISDIELEILYDELRNNNNGDSE